MSLFNLSTGVQTAPFVINTSNTQNPALSVSQSGGGGTIANFASGNNTAMVITNNGNVGIGTTAPQALLDINGLFMNKPIYFIVLSTQNRGSVTSAGIYNIFDSTSAVSIQQNINGMNSSIYGFQTSGANAFNFIVPVTGLYFVSMRIRFTNDGNTYTVVGGIEGGTFSGINGAQWSSSTPGSQRDVTSTLFYKFNVGDSIRAGFTLISNVTTSIYSGAVFQAFYIGNA